MSDNMCEHGGLDGNCLRCKDATITALREEAALYQKEWAILREEVERLKKELRILYASNADMFARAEQAERELAELQGKRNTAYSYIEDVLIGSPYEWTGKRLLEMIGDKK